MLSPDGIPVGINGIGGRIGGNTLRVMIEHPESKFNLLGGNDIGLDSSSPAQNFMQIKAFDTTFGSWPCEMCAKGDRLTLVTNGDVFQVKLLAERDPAEIPWGSEGVKGVAECTGAFRSRKQDGKTGYDSHLDGGAERVALSAPAKDDVLTVVYGVHTTPLKDVELLSAASCTSGSIAFPLRVLLDHRDPWGFVAGAIQTVHAYTAGEQQLQDYPAPIKPGSRRMSAGAVNIIPTTTGAAKAIPKVDGIGDDMKNIPFSGDAWRVPVISGSVTLMSIVLEKQPPLAAIIAAFQQAADGRFRGKFAVNRDPNASEDGRPLVSSHIVGRPESAIIDEEFCSQTGPIYLFPSWYGNEWGYVYRLVEALHEQCA